MGRFALVVLVGCLALAGCLGSPGFDSPTPAGDTPTSSETPHRSTPEAGNASVEYVVRSGRIASSVAHVYVDFGVYFAERPDDIYACTDGAPLLDNQYDPTPTPLATPAGDCHAFSVPRLDLAAINETRSLGRFTADATDTGAHTLVVHDVTVVLENGTTASKVYDTDFRAVTKRESPAGTHGVEIGVVDGNRSDVPKSLQYLVAVERFDPGDD